MKLVRGASLIDLLELAAKLPADEREQYEAFSGNDFHFEQFAAEMYGLPGPKWTILDDGQVLVVGGFMQRGPANWQDWLVTSPEAWSPSRWKGVTRRCRAAMDEMLQTHALRLQCVSLANREKAHAWYRVLGLQLEGQLRAYGANGEDALMFSRVRPHHG